MSYLFECDVCCPYCGERFDIMVDSSQGSYETIEDCAICCRPIRVVVSCEPGEVEGIFVDRA